MIDQHSSCTLCNSKKVDLYKGYESPALFKCADCGFVFTKDIPSSEALIDYYSSDYDRTSYFSPITAVRYMQLLESFEPFRKTNKILDLGCGYGFFLEIAKKKGWDVYGVEITQEAVEHCEEKGINMFKGEVKNVPFEPNSFDIIVSIEVLEHLNNPVEHVKKIHELMRSGGLHYMSTPNFNAYLRYKLKGNYDIIGYPNHLSYYTPRTLKKLFIQNGFKVKKMETTGISLTRLKTSKGKSNQEYVSETSDDEMLRYRTEKAPVLKFIKWSLNIILNLFKLGVTLKGSFVKS